MDNQANNSILELAIYQGAIEQRLRIKRGGLEFRTALRTNSLGGYHHTVMPSDIDGQETTEGGVK